MSRRQSQFELEPPVKGMVTESSYEKMPHGSSYLLKNVRLSDPIDGRPKLSKRAGLTKFVSTQVDSNPIQDMIQYIYAANTDGSGTQVRRTTTNLVVANGTIESFTGSAVSAVTGGASALSSSVHQIFSARLFGNVHFVDGTNRKYYNGSQVSAWTATSGTIATGCKLIEMWRGRIVLAGSPADPHNWFMSRQADAFDWDYSPDPIDEQMPVAGNNSEAGEIGDVVKAMVPYSDDYLIFGCDHSIWIMSGDPAYGGRIDAVSEDLGMAWGRPWCLSPQKHVYFFGSRGGVWRMLPPNGAPELVSAAIQNEFDDVDLETNTIKMAYDTQWNVVHLWITPISGTTAGTHYVYDVAHEAWITDVYASYNYDPYAVIVLDGDDPDDRELLIGGKDGYIRKFSSAVHGDDSSAFDSEAWYSPIYFRDNNHVVLKEVHAICSNDTDDVTMSIYSGMTAEDAVGSSAQWTRELASGRNYSDRRRATGRRIFVSMSDSDADSHWAIESLSVVCDSIDSGRKRWLT